MSLSYRLQRGKRQRKTSSDVLPPDGEPTTTAPSLFDDDPNEPFQADTGADFFRTKTTSHQDDSQGDLLPPHAVAMPYPNVAVTIGSGPPRVASASEAP